MGMHWVPSGLRIRGAAVFRGGLKAGESAYEAGRFVDALKYWRKTARHAHGSGEAEFRIGRLYRRGEGVFPNFAEAAHWFELRRAAWACRSEA